MPGVSAPWVSPSYSCGKAGLMCIHLCLGDLFSPECMCEKVCSTYCILDNILCKGRRGKGLSLMVLLLQDES